ncbi:unnamed protein product, partial [Sphacelaria rigidula]
PQLKQHAFFDGIDWLRLTQRHVIPPFIPKARVYTVIFRVQNLDEMMRTFC